MLTLPAEEFLLERAPLGPIKGCNGLVMHQSGDVFGLWEELEAQATGEIEVPYWATVWPGGILCARYLLKNPALVQNRSVLDLGSGGGVAAIAAAQAGARSVIANDIDPAALSFAARNAAANGVSLTFDNRDLITAGIFPDVDIILVADMFYQRTQAQQTLAYVRSAVDRDIIVIIADGQRTFAPRDCGVILAVEKIPVSPEVEGVDEREVRLIMLTKSGEGIRVKA
jgi:predicted nicotinamide N-methyase